ncbi:LLM class flavin-dependent oxidoreductase [Amycolatopsis sp. NPDC023774]|uniref:LLM class flavin-dependent oxidoreductase n=1 Tax=Amycolatopsis sp. NPDC023774 TaxID=3155015 RepID=UPI003400465B
MAVRVPAGGRHLAVLAAAAVVTNTVRLGTSVLVAPLHLPTQLAKELATVDQRAAAA